jgi:hypothetical protein
VALYDPREFPEAETVSPDFTMEEFLAWVRTKPAYEAYCYADSSRCALAQFGIATRRPHLVGPSGTAVLWRRPDLKEAINPCYAKPPHKTFGDLATRLEQALSK